MVVAWPERIQHPGRRDQFLYVTDVAPTILEAARVPAPASVGGIPQKALDGISFAYTFDHPDAPSLRRRQVFEVFTNLGIYDDGWFAGTAPGRAPWEVSKGSKLAVADRAWELYHLDRDYSQATNLAAVQSHKLEQMKALFWSEAARTGILPVRDALEGTRGKPVQAGDRTFFAYAPGITRVPESAAPPTIGRSFAIEADVVIPQGGGQGVLVTQGGLYGGYALYMIEGQLRFTYNAIPPRLYTIASNTRLEPGRHTLSMRFDSDGGPGAGGTVELRDNGKAIGRGRVDATLPVWISHTDGFDVGTDTITPIVDTYDLDDATFTGTLKELRIQLR
jgi:arylsulfatase